MSINRQWGTLEVMGLLEENRPAARANVQIASTPTKSPKPPPKAPCEVRAFSADPPSSSRNYLGGAPKGKIAKEQRPKEKMPKGEEFKGKEVQEKRYQRKRLQRKGSQRKDGIVQRGRDGGSRRPPLYFVF